MPHMFCYVWSERSNPNECKFGERWVKDGQDSETEVRRRIKDSVGVRKDLINSGEIVLDNIWDVTEYAQSVNRCYMHGRVDDHIRAHVGFRKEKTGEVHTLSSDELIVRVNEVLKKANAPLPEVGLAQWQYDAAVNVLTAVDQGSNTIVAELCARFGKTIWGGVLTKETGAPLTIIASYVQTVMTSFKKDLSGFDQFRGFVLVDTKDGDYQQQITDGLTQGKQVIALISMCNGGKRQDRIDFLFGQPVNKLVLIDEADFGAHKDKQTIPFKNGRTDDDVVVLMTGMNGDRAASTWNVDHYLSVTYPELVMEKRG